MREILPQSGSLFNDSVWVLFGWISARNAPSGRVMAGGKTAIGIGDQQKNSAVFFI